MSSAASGKIDDAKRAVVEVITEVFSDSLVDGHARLVDWVSDSPVATEEMQQVQRDQRCTAGAHLCLAAAAAALDVAALLLKRSNAGASENALRRGAIGAALAGEVASRAARVLADGAVREEDEQADAAAWPAPQRPAAVH
ncbi:hypothetical protein [Variovorax saccharolyticus]|uniref:hypothetical protein n=1 Tax=Variovorax saccharolyticus TaxID=3053516 RepID=UPI0025773B33|nr:hypothetical protein [Variovorax sp. J31P216]MDM0025343.1 hypothetical protein [Variovorax sp. J31P216]